MKKFQFSLEKVLSYKQQKQEALRSEHAEILALVRAPGGLGRVSLGTVPGIQRGIP